MQTPALAVAQEGQLRLRQVRQLRRLQDLRAQGWARDESINNAVKKIFKNYPPKSKT